MLMPKTVLNPIDKAMFKRVSLGEDVKKSHDNGRWDCFCKNFVLYHIPLKVRLLPPRLCWPPSREPDDPACHKLGVGAKESEDPSVLLLILALVPGPPAHTAPKGSILEKIYQ